MVFSEWPLANGLDEADELTKRAEASGIRTIVGLQARYSPVIRYAKDLISEGYIGDVLGTTLVGSGTAVSVYYRGGTSRGENMRWEISGTKGDLVITAPSGHTQLAELKLQGGRNQENYLEDLTVPDSYFGNHLPTGMPGNTARIYDQFAKDLREGTYTTPDFSHALRQHKLLSAIETASHTGMRQHLSNYI